MTTLHTLGNLSLSEGLQTKLRRRIFEYATSGDCSDTVSLKFKTKYTFYFKYILPIML